MSYFLAGCILNDASVADLFIFFLSDTVKFKEKIKFIKSIWQIGRSAITKTYKIPSVWLKGSRPGGQSASVLGANVYEKWIFGR